jgi:hypothetical protein
MATRGTTKGTSLANNSFGLATNNSFGLATNKSVTLATKGSSIALLWPLKAVVFGYGTARLGL